MSLVLGCLSRALPGAPCLSEEFLSCRLGINHRSGQILGAPCCVSGGKHTDVFSTRKVHKGVSNRYYFAGVSSTLLEGVELAQPRGELEARLLFA